MRTPADLRAWAAMKYRAGHRRWLACDDLGAGLELSYPLQPPSEASAVGDAGAVATWIAGWRAALVPAGVEVEWRSRRWQSLGAQQLPQRVVVRGSDAVAALAGTATAWRRLVATVQQLRVRWSGADLAGALPGVAGGLAALDAGDVGRLIAVVEWFVAHPGSGMLVRQVAVEGVDTKWLERHVALVQQLVATHTGTPELGLRKEPRRFRVRVLDPAVADGLLDFTAATAELAGLEWWPRCVLISENLQTLAALPPLPGVVAVHGNGLVAVELARVPWIARSPALYWGDLDSHGLAILGALRAVLPQTQSVLMDVATLERFGPLAIPEPNPRRGPIGHLTASESQALEVLRAGDLRLEQERIDFAYASHQIEDAVSRLVEQPSVKPIQIGAADIA